MKKRCACCGSTFSAIPADARFQREGGPLDGFYWECACLSTMFVPLEERAEFGDLGETEIERTVV